MTRTRRTRTISILRSIWLSGELGVGLHYTHFTAWASPRAKAASAPRRRETCAGSLKKEGRPCFASGGTCSRAGSCRIRRSAPRIAETFCRKGAVNASVGARGAGHGGHVQPVLPHPRNGESVRHAGCAGGGKGSRAEREPRRRGKKDSPARKGRYFGYGAEGARTRRAGEKRLRPHGGG